MTRGQIAKKIADGIIDGLENDGPRRYLESFDVGIEDEDKAAQAVTEAMQLVAKWFRRGWDQGRETIGDGA